MNRLELRFWGRVDIQGENECWLWRGGYFAPKHPNKPRIPSFWYDGQNRNAARVSYMLSRALESLPSGNHNKNLVCHTCDNPACINPKHLYLGTPQDNANDMVARGRSATGDRNARRLYPERYPKGTNSPNSKFADEDVETILTLSALGLDASKIARCFKVSATTIQGLLSSRTYAHLDKDTRQQIVVKRLKAGIEELLEAVKKL